MVGVHSDLLPLLTPRWFRLLNPQAPPLKSKLKADEGTPTSWKYFTGFSLQVPDEARLFGGGGGALDMFWPMFLLNI